MAVGEKLTLSVMKADVGGLVGHVSGHPEIIDTAKERLHNAREKGAISDYHVLRCGDDLDVIVTHRKGCDNPEIHELVWNTFRACSEVAGELKLHAAGDEVIEGAFSGALREAGPAVAEMEFTERASEPVIVFLANKTLYGTWNLPVYRVYADPFNTHGLITDPIMFEGFSFTVIDLKDGLEITLSTPAEALYLLALAGCSERYAITKVLRNADGEVASVTSAQRPRKVRGVEVGRCDPIAVMRCQKGFPAAGEVLEAFSFPHLVDGWMRGTHTGPLMPVPFYEANPSRFDGPPRIISAGFQIADGHLIGPHDMFDDPSFDESRRLANTVSEYMRRHGPFHPHRIPEGAERMTASDFIVEKLKDRFKAMDEGRKAPGDKAALG